MKSAAVVIAFFAWLGLTRLPLDGAALFVAVAAWGLAFGAAVGKWYAGLALLLVAVLGYLLALVFGWFAYLADFWFAPPAVGALAGTLGGLAATWIARSGSGGLTGSPGRDGTR